jgi:hypothetical protein
MIYFYLQLRQRSQLFSVKMTFKVMENFIFIPLKLIIHCSNYFKLYLADRHKFKYICIAIGDPGIKTGGEGCVPLNSVITPPHLCASPNPEYAYLTSYVVVLLVFNE